MESLKIHAEADDKMPVPDKTTAHGEALELTEKNRSFYEHYARGRVKFAPAPEGLNTFAFDLENDTIYLNGRFYKENYNFSDEKTSFATLHEIEHFLEKKAMLGEEDGAREFKKYLKRLEESKAYGLMDNCVADVRENSAVVSKTSEAFGEIERAAYKEDLFPEVDFTKDPRHIQFSQAFLRETRVPGEVCKVAPEVREKLDALKAIASPDGTKLTDVLTSPDTPMSERLKLQNQIVWPMVQELMKKDLEDKKKDGENKKGDKSEKGNGKGGEKENKEKQENSKGGGKEGKDSREAGRGKKLDPNEVFKDAYEKAAKRVPNAVPLEEVKKAFEEWQKANEGNPLDRADAEYAKKIGVEKKDLQKYRDIVESLNSIRNPETSETVVEELRRLFTRIIAKRLKPAMQPRYPVEEGEELVDPGELVAQAKAGNLEPKVWESYEFKEKQGQKFGEVEITLVCDRSGSMAGEKLAEQQKAAVLCMEALKEFGDLADSERVNVNKPLEVRSEVFSFQSSSVDAKPLKVMSKELGEAERIKVSGALGSSSGTTTDFVPLETIEQALAGSEEMKRKILEGELKKIVIVFTDGESDDAARVRGVLEKLRRHGVVPVGVGITEGGRSALATYAPEARLAETAEKLPTVLGDVLKDHLSSI